MATLTLTERGQVTLRKDVLKHLEVKPGDKLEMELLPNNEIRLRGARSSGRIQDVFGILAGKTTKVATIEEMNEAIAEGWAGKR